jgi:hypothetical protein
MDVKSILRHHFPEIDDTFVAYINGCIQELDPYWDDLFDQLDTWYPSSKDKIYDAIEDIQDAHRLYVEQSINTKRESQAHVMQIKMQQMHMHPKPPNNTPDKQSPIIPDEIKKRILTSYDLTHVSDEPPKNPSLHGIAYLQECTTKRRYFNDQIVTTNGAKYVDTPLSIENGNYFCDPIVDENVQ